LSLSQVNDYASARLIIVMGTCGCGKSTVGELLAQRLGAGFIEGDDVHSLENKAKMEQGTPLTDEDRWPWLQALGEALQSHSKDRGRTIASCSALKRSYREFITKAASEPVLFVYLQGSRQTLSSRLASREDHFMDSNLLDSQLETLEPPGIDEYSFAVNIEAPVAELVDRITHKII